MMTDFLHDNEVSSLLAKELAGTLSPEEDVKLNEWRQSHSELYDKITDIDNLRRRDELVRTIDVDGAWKKVKEKMEEPVGKKRHLSWLIPVAASVVLCVGIGLIWMNRPEKPELPDGGRVAQIEVGTSKALLITSDGREIGLQDSSIRQVVLEGGVTAMSDGKKVVYSDSLSVDDAAADTKYNTVRVPKGGEYELFLADHTKVMLNSETELRFPLKFGRDKRHVYLKGEAYFMVTKDAEHPFVVHISDRVSVEVLGTEFNVMAYPDELRIETTLNKGTVRVSDMKDSVVLNPDQQAVYDKSNQVLSTRPVVAAKYSAWKDGRFNFENASLESIMVRLGRWYNMDVVYMNPEAKSFHFTGDLERYENFDKALGMLEKATDVKFTIDKNNVIVSVVRRSQKK